MKDSQSHHVLPSNGQPEAEPSAAEVDLGARALFSHNEGWGAGGMFNPSTNYYFTVGSGEDKELADDLRAQARAVLIGSRTPPTAIPSEPGWQPISSAPRDGTHFFVTCRQEPRSEMYVGHWWIGLARFNPGYPNGPPYLEFESNSPSRPRREQIKLWMPLPSPPVEAASPAVAELGPGNSSDLRGEEG